MKKKKLAVTLALPLLLLTGCIQIGQPIQESEGSTEVSSKQKEEESSVEETEESSEEEIDNIETETSETKETTKESSASSSNSSSVSWSDLEQDLKEKTETTSLDMLYENMKPLIYEENDVEIQVKGYRYYEIKNFTRNLRIPFGDQNAEGGVIVLAVSLKNDTDKDVYYGNGFSFSLTGSRAYLTRTKNMITDDMEGTLISNDSKIKAGEELEGFIPFAVEPDEMEKISENKEASLQVPGIYTKKGSFKSSDALLEEHKETVPFGSAGEAKAETASEFYPDKATAENMGTKTMLVSKELNETKEFEGVKVTLDGYQFSDFEPNEDQESRFSKFETGVVLLTAKVTVQNNGKETLQFNDTSAALKIGSKVSMISQSALEVREKEDTLPIGETGTKYIAVPIDKESYDRLYKDQEFVLNVKLYEENHRQMTNNGDVEFKFNN